MTKTSNTDADKYYSIEEFAQSFLKHYDLCSKQKLVYSLTPFINDPDKLYNSNVKSVNVFKRNSVSDNQNTEIKREILLTQTGDFVFLKSGERKSIDASNFLSELSSALKESGNGEHEDRMNFISAIIIQELESNVGKEISSQPPQPDNQEGPDRKSPDQNPVSTDSIPLETRHIEETQQVRDRDTPREIQNKNPRGLDNFIEAHTNYFTKELTSFLNNAGSFVNQILIGKNDNGRGRNNGGGGR